MKTIAYNEVLFLAAEAAGRTRDNLPLMEAALLKSVFNLELARVWASEDWDDTRQPLLAVSLDANQSFPNPYVQTVTTQVSVAAAGTAAANGIYTFQTGAAPIFFGAQQITEYYLHTSGNFAIANVPALDPVLVWTMVQIDAGSLLYSSASLLGAWGGIIDGQNPNPTLTNPTATFALGEVLGVFSQLPTGGTPWQRLDLFRTGDTFTVTPALNHPARGNVPVPATVYLYWQSPCPDLLALSATDLAALTLPLVFGKYLAWLGAGHLLTADGAASLAGMQIGLARSDLDFQRTRIQRPPWTKVN